MTDRVQQTMPNFCDRHAPSHFTTALMALRKMGVDPVRIDLLAVGEQQNYRGEVQEQDPPAGTPLAEGTKITLRIGCWSAVDTMPYQFFYGLGHSANRTSEWEERARRLMAPFDSAFIRHSAAVAWQQLRYSMSSGDREHISRFLELFAFDVGANTDTAGEALIWAALFPTFHAWAGNPFFVERVLQIFFGYEIEIVENVAGEYRIPDDLRYRVGARAEQLGRGTILGRSFSECDSRYAVIVKGVEPANMRSFLPGQKNRVRLERMLGFCMPGDLEFSVRLVPNVRACVLGRADGNSYLGYNACA